MYYSSVWTAGWSIVIIMKIISYNDGTDGFKNMKELL